MAWRSSGDSHASLVHALAKHRLLRSEIVVQAFRAVDRAWFVPRALASVAYEDRPLPIGHAATISAPHMHAIMAEIMAPYVVGEHKRVLDVGSGSGFLTCVLAAMMNSTSSVVGVEHVPQLVAFSLQAAEEHFKEWMSPAPGQAYPRLTLLQGDGLHLHPSILPFPQFDAIHVGAAPVEVPKCLVDLLAPNGVIVVPVGAQGDAQDLVVVTKDTHGQVTTRVDSQVQFVPLTALENQLREA
jgi:protein-L-isoaspartate(D-aspartate) O-methyltransferase